MSSDQTQSSDLSYEPEVLRVLQTKDATRSYYNKIAKVYDMLSEHSEGPLKRKGVEILKPQPGEDILEVGFGTGHILVDLAKAVGESGKVRGIDISDEMVEQAKTRLEGEGLLSRVELTRGDATEMPYEDGSLDAIYFSFTLELFDTPEIPKVLHECLRVLKPSGRLMVVAVSREGEGDFMRKLYEWTHRHLPNLMDCRPIYVKRAMEANGFEIREASIESMWVPVELVLGGKPN